MVFYHQSGDVPCARLALAHDLPGPELITILALPDGDGAFADVHDPIGTLPGFLIWIPMHMAEAPDVFLE